MVKIGMTENVSDMIRTAQRDMSGTERIPTGVHLLSVNTTSATYLNESDAQHFHHIVAKLLVLSRRSIPDIQTAVAFLTTRVKKMITRNCTMISITSKEHQRCHLSYVHIAQMRQASGWIHYLPLIMTLEATEVVS